MDQNRSHPVICRQECCGNLPRARGPESTIQDSRLDSKREAWDVAISDYGFCSVLRRMQRRDEGPASLKTSNYSSFQNAGKGIWNKVEGSARADWAKFPHSGNPGGLNGSMQHL